MPALAVADELRARGAAVSFLGAEGRAEAELVPAAGYEVDLVRVSGLDRRNPLRALRAAGQAAMALPAARRALRSRGSEALLGGGGFVAGPAGLAALSLRLPLVLTEADSDLGLANRLLAPRARRVCLAFPIPGREGGRYLVTGRAVPAAVLNADRARSRERFGIAADERCLLVMGGSQGARSINFTSVEAFAQPQAPDTGPDRDFHVLHLAGRRDHARLRELLEEAEPERYTLLEYEPHLGEVLAACDLVLARAGGSIFEIAAAGKPAVLVPYPHATADHQSTNAAWMAGAGAAVALPDRQLEPARLVSLVAELFGDAQRLARMAAASRSLARPDAAIRIADEVLAATPS